MKTGFNKLAEIITGYSKALNDNVASEKALDSDTTRSASYKTAQRAALQSELNKLSIDTESAWNAAVDYTINEYGKELNSWKNAGNAELSNTLKAIELAGADMLRGEVDAVCKPFMGDNLTIKVLFSAFKKVGNSIGAKQAATYIIDVSSDLADMGARLHRVMFSQAAGLERIANRLQKMAKMYGETIDMSSVTDPYEMATWQKEAGLR